MFLTNKEPRRNAPAGGSVGRSAHDSAKAAAQNLSLLLRLKYGAGILRHRAGRVRLTQ